MFSDITATGGLLLFRNVTSFNGSIDNVSVQEIVSSGDFTFSRGSNLAATRVDVNGLIEKGRENLALYQISLTMHIGVSVYKDQLHARPNRFRYPNNAWTITVQDSIWPVDVAVQAIVQQGTTISFLLSKERQDEITIWTAQSSVASLTYILTHNGDK